MPSALKQYFEHYLCNVKNVKASAKKYSGALNTISRFLKAKGVVKESIYELSTLNQLHEVNEILKLDDEFQALNNRGNHMYSAGLNNYIKFAEGHFFRGWENDSSVMDIILPPSEKEQVTTSRWIRSDIIRIQSIELAQNKCEIDNAHITFTARVDNKPYMEGHHAIPIHYQNEFAHSLDVYANIVCLCPNCHKFLHYGSNGERKRVLSNIYDMRKDRLMVSGIDVSRGDFIDLAIK